ncbi:MAG: T9SS type A sorting domain-containing protein [Bacteroidia bacterium]
MKKIYLLCILLYTLNALSQSGFLDNSFGSGGKVTTGFGTNNNSRANVVAVQPDGKIIVGGAAYTANTVNTWQKDSDNITLVRYNTNGTVDTTFGNNGTVMTDLYKYYNNNSRGGTVYAIKIQPDGKILIHGSAISDTGSEAIIMRYNSNGSIDTGFGISGKVTCNSGPVDSGNTLILQPDGKITVLGIQWTQPRANVWNTQFVVERFNGNGSKDAAFGADGRVVTIFGNGGYDMPEAIALQPDGKILAAGFSSNTFAVARYTVNGTLDTTFDGDGKLTTSFGTGSNGSAKFVTVRADGKILVAGYIGFNTTNVLNFAVAQYNINGSLDTTFDGDGKASHPFDENDDSFSINTILTQPDGKLLVTTSGLYDSTYFTVRRYNGNATPDTTFGTNGKVTTTIQEGYNQAKGLALEPGGNIIVAGLSHTLPVTRDDFTTVRYQGNGTLDPTFGNGGILTQSFDSTNDESTILLLQPDNKLLAIGTKRNRTPNNYSYKDIVLSRYTTDGGPDTAFGTGGKVVSAYGYNVNTVKNAVLLPDGKIMLMNSYYNNYVDNTNHYELIRYTADGVLDSTFGTNGKVVVDAESNQMFSLPDGKIILVSMAYDTQNNATIVVRRYNSNGTPDTGFGINGMASTPGTPFGLPCAALQADGKIVAGYNGMAENGAIGFTVKRFNADGSFDVNFTSTITVTDNGAYTHSTFIQPDGKIIVTGRSVGYNEGPFYRFVAARYNTDGTSDTTYGTNGVVASYLAGLNEPYNIIQSVIHQPDGKFLLALSKQEPRPAYPTPDTYDFVLTRFNAEGGLDYDFGSLGQVSTRFYNKYDEAFTMVLQPDGKIVAGGTTDTGINRDFALARYENLITSGIEEITEKHGLVVYPNPGKGLLNIKLPVNNAAITGIKMYNMLGQMVYSSNKGDTSISIVNLEAGIYSIAVTTGSGSWQSKFIKE